MNRFIFLCLSVGFSFSADAWSNQYAHVSCGVKTQEGVEFVAKGYFRFDENQVEIDVAQNLLRIPEAKKIETRYGVRTIDGCLKSYLQEAYDGFGTVNARRRWNVMIAQLVNGSHDLYCSLVGSVVQKFESREDFLDSLYKKYEQRPNGRIRFSPEALQHRGCLVDGLRE